MGSEGNVENSKGLLAVWTDIAPEVEEDFCAWYDREHLPERAANRGFLNARRYRLAEGATTWGEAARYFAGYDTERLASLGSPSYVEALANQTPWSNRLFPHFKNTSRMIAGLIGEAGRGLAGAILARHAPLKPAQWEALHAAVAGGQLQEILRQNGVTRVCLAAGVLAPLGSDPVDNVEQATRAPGEGGLLVEGESISALENLCAGHLAGLDLPLLGPHGAPLQGGLYRLAYAIQN